MWAAGLIIAGLEFGEVPLDLHLLRGPSVRNCKPITVFPTLEIPATSVVLLEFSDQLPVSHWISAYVTASG